VELIRVGDGDADVEGAVASFQGAGMPEAPFSRLLSINAWTMTPVALLVNITSSFVCQLGGQTTAISSFT
jgi:hypothetical protein